MTWLERYRQGRRAEVWLELRQLGARVRETEHVAEATRVCDEMARRARHDVEVLVERMTAAGVRFHVNDAARTPAVPFVPATPASSAYAAWLDQTVGPVPLTVLSWIREVGDVWLVGSHPTLDGMPGTDPLVVELEGSRHPGSSMRGFVLEEVEAWREVSADDAQAGPFVLPVAPDRLTKGDVSGGAPYGFVLPDGSADGLVQGETTEPFVSYLNRVFAAGGLPWTAAADRGWWAWRRELARELLPL